MIHSPKDTMVTWCGRGVRFLPSLSPEAPSVLPPLDTATSLPVKEPFGD